MDRHSTPGGGPVSDLVVIGGGMGGLAAAALAQRLGIRTALLEAHTRLGGCAGYFSRGTFTFDASATALMGLRPGGPVGDLLGVLEVPFSAEPTRSYRVHLPDRRLDIVADSRRFIESSVATFPATEGGSAAGQRRFRRLQEAVGGPLFAAAAGVPRLPPRSWTSMRRSVDCLADRPGASTRRLPVTLGNRGSS
jgi:phytoene dehydrogenase-like protein